MAVRWWFLWRGYHTISLHRVWMSSVGLLLVVGPSGCGDEPGAVPRLRSWEGGFFL